MGPSTKEIQVGGGVSVGGGDLGIQCSSQRENKQVGTYI